MTIGIAALLTGCSGDDITTGSSLEGKGYDPVGTPVQFSVGLEGKATTRADMADGGRFVCTMYSRLSENGNYDVRDPYNNSGTMQTAWLQIDGDGNAKYMNYQFSADETPLCWKNRWSHIFLALADYNQLTTNVGATTKINSQGKLKMFPSHDIVLEIQEGIYTNSYYANTYDLTKENRGSMAGQPDPILALKEITPTSNPSANVVNLVFEHQFAQIQVNVKDAGNASAITEDNISNVELIGVSKEGYVFSVIRSNGYLKPASHNDVTQNFRMFVMGTPESGYLKSFNAIAFGHLASIRVTWNDGANDHTSTYNVNSDLASGKKYVYNFSLQKPATSRGDVGNRAQAAELVLDGDVEITNWPVNFE